MTVVARVEQPTFVNGETVLVPVSVSQLFTGDCGRVPVDLTGATAVTLHTERLDGSAFATLAVSNTPDATGLLEFQWSGTGPTGKYKTELRYTLAGESRRLKAGRIAILPALP